MLELYFLRHAKSDWDSVDGNDFNRNISKLQLEELVIEKLRHIF